MYENFFNFLKLQNWNLDKGGFGASSDFRSGSSQRVIACSDSGFTIPDSISRSEK